MKTDKQWEARAKELWADHRRESLGGWAINAMLQLGREMAAEERAECGGDDWRAAVRVAELRAADARAEEIAKAMDKCAREQRDLADSNQRMCRPTLSEIVAATAFDIAASHARSTITKPKEPASPIVVDFTPQTEAAIRADEREKVAKRIEACEGQWPNTFGDPMMCVATAAAVARAGEPKTREQVLEEALRDVRETALVLGCDDMRRSIDEALRWTP